MKQQVKFISASLILLLSACVNNTHRTQKTTEVNNKEPIQNTVDYQPNWINQINDLKPYVRSCYITKKSTEFIRYATVSQKEALVVLGDLSGQQYDCKVDLTSTQKTAVIEKSSRTIGQNIPVFYPINRVAKKCSNPVIQKDGQGRVMGTVCTL